MQRQHGKRSTLWTASQFLSSIEPCRMSHVIDAAIELDGLVRQAHGVAALNDYGWNPNGQYPLAVWIKAYRIDFGPGA